MADKPAQCVACRTTLEIAGYLRQGGKPATYQPTHYCTNHECYRYGLVSVYKAIGTG